MLRRMLFAAILLGIVGAGIYWWLTTPAIVAANSLASYQPNLANGLTTFTDPSLAASNPVANMAIL